jgi:hypothetical protein
MPETIKTTRAKSGYASVESWREFSYTQEGLCQTATAPVTAAEKDDAAQKEKLTVTQKYHGMTQNGDSIRLPSGSEWFPDFDKPLASEAASFDAQGRVTSQTDAMGDVTAFQYENPLNGKYASKPEYVLQGDVNRMYGLLNADVKTRYAFQSDVYMARVYQCDENGVETMPAEFDYSRIYNRLTDKWLYPDENAYIYTSYYYDSLGRLTNVYYPTAQGENGNLWLSEEYEYDESVQLAAYGNRRLLQVKKWLYDDETQKKIYQTKRGRFPKKISLAEFGARSREKSIDKRAPICYSKIQKKQKRKKI